MKFEIQTIRKYIVESADVGSTLETIKNSNEQVVRILDYVAPVVVETPQE
jgi:hypothetical protein